MSDRGHLRSLRCLNRLASASLLLRRPRYRAHNLDWTTIWTAVLVLLFVAPFLRLAILESLSLPYLGDLNAEVVACTP